jgi:hypothetical protein
VAAHRSAVLAAVDASSSRARTIAQTRGASRRSGPPSLARPAAFIAIQREGSGAPASSIA